VARVPPAQPTTTTCAVSATKLEFRPGTCQHRCGRRKKRVHGSYDAKTGTCDHESDRPSRVDGPSGLHGADVYPHTAGSGLAVVWPSG